MRFSNSCVNTFALCERKGFYKYIERRDVDDNYKPSSALKIGRVVDKVLEICRTDYKKMDMTLLRAIQTQEEATEEHLAKAAACLRTFYANFGCEHREILATQVEISDNDYVGYIDAIIVDHETKKWYMVDFKTATSLDPLIDNSLKNNQQVALYLHHLDAVAFMYDLGLENFGGFIYLEMEKSSQRMRTTPTKTKAPETYEEFSMRIKEGAYRETIIQKEDINPSVLSGFYARIERIKNIQSINDAPMCQASCMAYHSPCEYYSACYGIQFEKPSKE
jgi:hypothetical protein